MLPTKELSIMFVGKKTMLGAADCIGSMGRRGRQESLCLLGCRNETNFQERQIWTNMAVVHISSEGI